MSEEINQNPAEMSFVEHLEELRWHLIRSISAIAVFSILAFLAKTFVFDVLLLGPKKSDFLTYQAFCKFSTWVGLDKTLCLQPANFEVVNLDMMGQFLTHLKVSIAIGFIIAFPYFLWEMWRFIRPGLLQNEQQYTRGVVSISSLLFMIGVSFGYLVLSPLSINFFASYSVSGSVSNTIALSSYISIITTLVLASGIMFELPMVVYFLSKMGLLTPDNMKAYRRHAFIVILLIAAIITPADVWTQILVTLPVYVLYEISIFVSARVAPKSKEIAVNKEVI